MRLGEVTLSKARFPFIRNRLLTTTNASASRNRRKCQSIGMFGRSSGNHDWMIANASASVSCGFRLRNASDCVWMETGLYCVKITLMRSAQLTSWWRGMCNLCNVLYELTPLVCLCCIVVFVYIFYFVLLCTFSMLASAFRANLNVFNKIIYKKRYYDGIMTSLRR